MHFNVKSDVIYELLFENKNIINPWGIETADTSSFFSLERNVGYRYNTLCSEEEFSHSEYRYIREIQMLKGKWRLEGFDKIEDNKIIRSAKLICLEDTLLMDFVMRFRFKKEFFSKAYIYNNEIEHANTNVYYQYPTKHVELFGCFNAKIKVLECKMPNKLKPYMYVRDYKDEWVVHARMLPKVKEVKVIKLCNRWCKTKPVPQVLNTILCNCKKIYEYLEYHSERKPYKSFFLKVIAPNAFPLVWINKDEELEWKIEVKIERKE